MAIEALVVVVTAVLGIQEPTTGIDFPLPSDAACLFIPDGPRPDDCPAVEPEKLRTLMGPETWLYVTTKDGKTTLRGIVRKVRGVSAWSDETIDRFIDGAASGITQQGKFVPVRRDPVNHTVLTYGGLKVAEFALDPDLEAQKAIGKLMRVHGYLIPVNDTLLVMMETMTGETELARKAMLNLKAPGSLKPDSDLFGTGGSFRMGYLAGRVTCGLIVLIGGVVVLARALRRKKPGAAG